MTKKEATAIKDFAEALGANTEIKELNSEKKAWAIRFPDISHPNSTICKEVGKHMAIRAIVEDEREK